MDAEINQPTVRRRTREEIRQILAEFATGGMQQSDFCRTRGISRSALDRYLRKQRMQNQGNGTSTQLLAVELETAHGSLSSNSGGLVVALESGRKIEVHRGFDVPTLERLVSILERV
jgi:transposase-like protein